MKGLGSFFAFFALALSVNAATPSVMLISDRGLTVSYATDDGYYQGEKIKLNSGGDFYRGEYNGEGLGGATFTAPDVPGCQFDGWYTFVKNVGYDETSVANCSVRLTNEKEIGSSMYMRSAKTSSACYDDYVLCLKYSYLPLTVSFNGNGATSGTMDPVANKNYDSKFDLQKNGFVRTGYVFGGWSNRVGKVFADGASVTGSDFWDTDHFESTLYAIWNESSYGLAYDPDVTGPASVTFEEVFSVPDMAKTGYEFKGWKVENANFTTAKYGSSKGSVNQPIAANTVCKGLDGQTWFRCLNSTGGTVRLVAQFEAKSYTVTFVNMGGTGGPTSMSVTYDAKPKDVSNVPTKDGNQFMGFAIEGVRYWDANGLSLKDKWDIPSDCTAYAQWEAKTFYIEYDANGGSGTISSLFCTNGVAMTLSDGSGFSRPGCALLGWSTSKTASSPQYELGKTYQLGFSENTTLYAVWEVAYFIGFNGFGATSGMMEPQKFKQGEQKELTRNSYAKTGYSFGGWAKDEAGARALTPTYKDGELFTGQVDVPGSTNWLYAVWNANTYHVAFDANGGTGSVPKPIDCRYDEPVTIPAPSADLVKTPFNFAGWSNTVAHVVYAELPTVVSNLSTLANGTNTLVAVWKLSDLSEAMHCVNLGWESVADRDYQQSKIAWTVICGADEGFEESGSCARQSAPTEMGTPQMLTAEVVESGTLSFRWRGSAEESAIMFSVSRARDLRGATQDLMASGANEWNYFSTNLVVTAEAWVHIHNYTRDGAVDIDQMTWIPGGTNPEPTDADRVTISTAAVLDGKFVLSFKSKAEFDYNLLTNADLLVDSWGVMETKEGAGEDLTFEPQIIEGQPQMFYRVDTIKRK